MAIADKYEIMEDSIGLYYIYTDRRGIGWKTRVREVKCLTCHKPMHQIIRNGIGIQKYCCRKCRPITRGFKRDKANMNMDGLKLGRGWNKGLKNYLSEESIKKMRESHIGRIRENAPNWRGGTRSEDKLIRGRYEYNEWRYSVFERDDYTCQHCKKRGVNLNAHHIKGFKDYPELRYEIDNGITLCIPCHIEEHKRIRRLKNHGRG